MRTTLAVLSLLVALLPRTSTASESSDDTAKRLGESKHSLLDGIKQAQKSDGLPISAKFEVEDGKLLLSVYTAKDGKAKDAEHNTLMELKGEPVSADWTPKTEVFADKEHIARSAMQLSVLQVGKLSLEDAIKKASTARKGTVYSAIPGIQGGRPVVEVLIASADGKSSVVHVDTQTGKVAK